MVAALVFSMVTVGSLPMSPHVAAAPEPATQALTSTLEQLGAVTATAASIEELAEAIPLTGLAPTAPDGLDLLNRLSTALAGVKAAVDDSMELPADIADDLENADVALAGGYVFVIGCDDDDCSDPGEQGVEVVDNAGVIDYTIPISLSYTTQVPLAFDSDVFDMDGSPIDVALSASTTLQLRFDTTEFGTPAFDAGTAFALFAPPAVSVTVDVDAAADITAATRIGVADATATLAGLTIDVDFVAPVVDPDGDGLITNEEWMNTLVDDLVGDVVRTGSVSGQLTFDTDLIAGSPDAPAIPIDDADLGDGYSFVLPDLGDLADFSLISPAAIVAGIGQAAAGIGGAQSVGDIDLPFISGSVRRLALASRPILDVVDALGVICGTEGAGNVVPSGSVEDLPAGTIVYCRAVVTTGVQAGSVMWSSPGATGSGGDATVGTAPTENAEFVTGPGTDGQDFDVQVAYTATFDDDNDGTVDRSEPRTSEQPPRSVQALARALVELGPFDSLPTDLFAYDPGTHALTADLSLTVDPPSVTLPINVGSQLESETGIAGLQTTSGDLTADAGSISIALESGVFLLPPDDWDQVQRAGGGCPDPSITDLADCDDALNLFFVKVDEAAGAHEFAIADASFTANSPTLSGQLGYIEVTASVPQFELVRADDTSPLFSIDLEPSGVMTVLGQPVPGAIPLRELLFDITGRTTASSLNLGFTGNFLVNARLDGVDIGQAGVGVSWDPVFVGEPTIDPDLDFDGLFENFNPVPNLFGQATNAAPSTTVLEASGANFGSSVVGARVVNTTDGSSCEVSAFTATSLTCDDPLGGSENSEWNDGDLYRVEIGSALAMLETLLDNLDQIIATIDNASGAGLGEALDTELPIVGISPRALLSQIEDIRRTIDEIRRPAADVNCGSEFTGGTVSGDPNAVVYDGSGEATIYCQAVHTKPATDVTWSSTTVGATVTPPASPDDSVASEPSDAATILLTGGTEGENVTERSPETPDGFFATVSFADNDGPHDAEYPSLSQPSSIQKLADVINEKLGLGDAVGLTIDTIDGNSAVILDLAVGRCSSADLCGADVNADSLETDINADVTGLGDLVAATSEGAIDVDYDANARLRLGFALSLTTPQVYVLPGTGVELEGRFAATDLDFEAAFGPFAIQAGTSVVDDGGTPDDDTDDVGGLGTVKLGAKLSVGGAIAAPITVGTFLGDLATYLAPTFTALDDQSCGSVISDDPNPGDTQVLEGLGCAAISVGLGVGDASTYVADLGLVVGLAGGEFTITPYIPDNLLAEFAAAALDLELLLKALPEIIGSVEDGLRAASSSVAGNNKLPLVGDALDAGADVAGALSDIADTVVNAIPEEVYDATTIDGLETELQNFIFTSLSGTGLLRTADGTAPASAATDIIVIPDCGGCDESAANSTLLLQDLRVIFGIGQDLVNTEIPFDLGMDGVPLSLAGSLAPEVSWNFVVDLGLSRSDGPYVGVADPGGAGIRPDEELALFASIGLGDVADTSICPGLSDSPIDDGNWSNTKCLAGQVAFLGVNVADNAGNPTALSLTTGLDVSNGASETLSIGNAGDISLDPVLQLDANVDLAFRTGIIGGQAAGFPSVVGHFDLDWAFDPLNPGDATANRELAIAFDDLYLDVGPLIEQFLDPILSEVRRFTGPFQPVIDTLTAPIPVVSDLAALVGQPPVTLLGLMELISENDLSLIQSIAAFITFVNNAPTGGGYFPLGVGGLGGAFTVDGAGGRTAQGPTSAASLVNPTSLNPGSLLSSAPLGNDGTGTGSSNISTLAQQPTASTKANLPGTFGVPGLTFPFLDNPSQIFGLIMGQDITLVRYDFGPLEASAGFSYNFPPIMVGPVPIAIGVGGSVTVRGRFAVGYDTSGLRKVLSGGSGVYLFDGIFLDDLDAGGVDVPEISFIGEVYAQAGVSIVIASAGIVAGLRITVDLNLNDDPEPDGKLRIEEIFNKLQNPICLFDVSGKLEAFIKAFVELNLFLFSLRFEFTILELELLNFSGKCQPPKPVLAANDSGILRLNIGDRASMRNISVEEKNEEFTVRPINDQGGYSVAAFGVYQTFGPGGEFGGDPITSVVGNAIDGDDRLLMLPGRNQEEQPEAGTGAPEDSSIPFTVGVDLNGGDGNDVIQGGDGSDTLQGGKGNDRLEGGKGDDFIYGFDTNPGDDALEDDETDVDTLNGDEGDDRLFGRLQGDQLQGGPGDDRLEGGPGADLLQGGPGTGAATGTDGSDTLIGDPGPDTLEGGTGNDFLYGEEEIVDPSTCADDTADPGVSAEESQDRISGGDGVDVLFGGFGDDEMYGGSGNDLLCGNAGDDLIDGDAGGDTTETDTNPEERVDTSGGDDTAQGGTGNDTVTGNFGHDFLLGNGGSDLLSGGPGNDDVAGGTGDDRVNGDEGVDILVGDDAAISQAYGPGTSKATRSIPFVLQLQVSGVGGGDGGTPSCGGFGDAGATDLADCLRGGDDDDLIYGEGGNDDIDAGDGDDLVFGGEGADDPVRGNAGADVMYGNEQNDVMFGDSGEDRMFGDAGNDDMRGGIDDDYLEGNEGTDTMRGDAGQDDLIGGSAISGKSDSTDLILGGALADVIVGDNGTIIRPGGNDVDDPTIIARDVEIFDIGANTVGGGDLILGELANDVVFGGNGDDIVSGGPGRDLLEGNDGNDTITGNGGNDRIAGGSSSRATLRDPVAAEVEYSDAPDRATDAGDDSGDVLNGSDDDDVIAGDNALVNVDGSVVMTDENGSAVFGDDLIHGNDGRDRIYGQLGGDTMFGDDGEDYLLGDLGSIAATPTKVWPGGALDYDVDLDQPGPDTVGDGDFTFGADLMQGNADDDHMFGGAGDDRMQGNEADDYMEGNGGSDAMYGFAPDTSDSGTDQDDMIGGSSSWTRSDDIRRDDGELLMQGNSDRDVMTGDNADIERTTTDDGADWADDEVIPGARKRVVTLLDREKPDLTAVSGDDHMQGNADSDRMFGEGGSDLVTGNGADDLIEGNQDADWLEGNDGEDDIIGGSSLLASSGGIPLVGAGDDLGDPDAGDAIFGGADADVITGDNAVVVRKTAGNLAVYDAALAATGLAAPYFTTDPDDAVPGWWLGVTTDRLVRLHDRSTLNDGRFGIDVISAGQGEDIVFGQDGTDWATGGADDDAMEGNGGMDRLYGDRSPEDAADVPFLPAGVQAWVDAGLVSTGTARDGAAGPDGEDDIAGGSNVDHRDTADSIEGDGEDDFIIGDNGTIRRQISGGVYVDAPGDGDGHARVFRRVDRLAPGTFGNGRSGGDDLRGNDGDDAIWGQDGDDELRGQAGDDDLLGELGDDLIYGGTGEDAMVGDRGSVLNTELGAGGALFAEAQSTESYNGPPFLTDVTYFTTGRYDRRVDLQIDRAGAVGGPFPGGADLELALDGNGAGGRDTMRGGPDRDSMHGAAGDDIMNGDDHADYLFGGYGSDVMWGGRGNPDGSVELGADYGLVDRLFGGHGGDPANDAGIVTGGADVLDYKPRSIANGDQYDDPPEWHAATGPYTDGTADGGSATSQHHEGVDWMYGGWDRDVMGGNATEPGPNLGDRMWDWTGAFNLFTHCAPDYGGYNNIRARSPQMERFLEYLAFDSGIGIDLDDVEEPGSSAFEELGFVYKKDNRGNTGRAYPSTPGHFEEAAGCDEVPPQTP